MSGPYCSQCGQSARSLNVPLGRFLAHAAGELFGADSRLGATLKPLLFRPGYVAHEYNEGRRARFVPPVRLYLFSSFLFFVTLAFSPGSTLVTNFNDDDAPADEEVAPSRAAEPIAAQDSTTTDSTNVPRFTVGGREVVRADSSGGLMSVFFERLGDSFENQDELIGAFANRWGQVMFFLVPLFALLLKLVFRDRLYVQHLIYTLYFHVMVFSLITLVNLPSVFRWPQATEVLGLAQLWIPIYFYLGLRRVYEQSRVKTLLKSGFVLATYLVLLLFGMFAALILAVML